MKGYKAFNRGMVCNGKQYAENTIFEESGANDCCQAGVMHYCETPFDTLDYYPLVDDQGNFSEFAEVEPLDKVFVNGNKCATKKIKIGAKLSFKDFINAGVGVLIESTKPKRVSDEKNSSGYSAQIGSSGYSAQIGSSGNSAQIGSSGYSAQIGSSGDYAKIGSSGYSAQIGSSGNSAKIGSSGDYAQIGSSGNSAQIGSSGDYAKIGSSGDYAKIGSSGNSAQIGSSGYSAQITATGKDSVVAAIGINSAIRASLGSWITLAEYGDWNGRYYPVKCVKSAQVDGETIKPDTWYRLKNGEFVEVCDEE